MLSKLLKPTQRQVRFFGVIGLLLAATLTIPFGRFALQSSFYRDVYYAVQKGDVMKMQKLLENGASPNGIRGAFIGGTPLIWATKKSDVAMMKVLIRAGADVNQQSDYQETALMYAKAPQSAQTLIDAGANPKLRSERGLTAWDYMKKEKLEKVAKVLEQAQKDAAS